MSVNVARNGAIMAGRAQEYIKAWADQIEATRNALQTQLDAYNATEESNAGRLL